VIHNPASFFSDGVRLEGCLYLPEPGDAAPGRPLVVACSGFTGLRTIHPERFARSLTRRGYPCFGFDYRGFAPSGGAPRRVLLEEQVRDIRAAATFASEMPEVDGAPVVLLGWGMGGGLILSAASEVPRLAGLVCVNGFYNGRRVQRALRGEAGYRRFLDWVIEERRAAVRSAEPRTADPFDIYPLDPVSRTYVDDVLRPHEGYQGHGYDTCLADSLLGFAPEEQLGELEAIPLLVAHGDQNALHPVGEAESLHRRYPGRKELYWIEGGGHTEFMHDENPLYRGLAERIATWLDRLG
jgi:hypothetical protein